MTERRKNARKVGELVERTGLSVRSLHHYEEIGLSVPSGRTESGYRLYSDGDVLRLQQVASLRSLGFSLGEVGECLDDPGFSPERVIGLHAGRLRERMEMETRLCERLEAIAAPRLSENLERYYTPEQRERGGRGDPIMPRRDASTPADAKGRVPPGRSISGSVLAPALGRRKTATGVGTCSGTRSDGPIPSRWSVWRVPPVGLPVTRRTLQFISQTR